ncbi:ATP-grasp domain-containing protein [Streptomyces sp. NPDC048057]|uniref:ATP-grasp domain-containing protein n=1 Tax=Streptomyces sp. NPDC048057 TaxID=3155628 RepID=UPI0033F74C1C
MGSPAGRPPPRPTAVIVDGYSTGNFLPRAFADLGVDVVHVQSTTDVIPTVLAPALHEYAARYVCAGPNDVGVTVAALREHRPVAVLAGQEPGVVLADLLAERLHLAGNGAAGSRARRDKHAMIEALRAAGLRCARQTKARTAGDAVAWAARHGSWPVVVKPLSSASTDHVAICPGPREVEAASAAVLGTRDLFHDANDEVLVQSFLPGTEYIVDTVSVDGSRYVCGVWEYVKTTTPAGRRIYDRDVLLAHDAPVVPALVRYVDRVLDVLGIRHGPAHSEVIMGPQGPALVEVGARLNGNMHPGFHDVCLGANQADLTALAHARPGEFLRRYGGRSYTRRQPAVVHSTSTAREGVVAAVDHAAVAAISALPSVHFTGVKLRPGQLLRPTVDLVTSPLRVFMTAPCAESLEVDLRAVRELKDRVYVLRSPAAVPAGQR